MRARRAQSVALLLTLALALLGSCSSNKDDPSAGATLPPSSTKPPTTTTTTAADPFAIPKVIDEAYVNKVLAALGQVAGDALRSVVVSGKVSSEVATMLRAIYNDPQFEQELDGLIRVFGEGLEPFKRPPGNRIRTVRRLITAGEDCIFVEVVSDFSEVLKAPKPDPSDEVEIVTLRRTQASANPNGLNPTPWSIGNSEVIAVGEAPADRARCSE